MLSSAMRDRLSVVLVGARNPANIGAAARAMRDFGFSDLRFVNDYAVPFEAAQLETPKSAVRAAEVMQRARAFGTIEDALADRTLIVGTTAIGERQLSHRVMSLVEAGPLMLDGLADPQHRVALLFGSEKTGLTNEQLSHCQLLLTIPMFAPDGERHLSMNLGQAVAVCLYELARIGFEGSRELPVVRVHPVSAESRERLTQLLFQAMKATAYSQRFPANAREHIVRQLAMQLGTSREEADTWMGFLRQVLRTANKNAPE